MAWCAAYATSPLTNECSASFQDSRKRRVHDLRCRLRHTQPMGSTIRRSAQSLRRSRFASSSTVRTRRAMRSSTRSRSKASKWSRSLRRLRRELWLSRRWLSQAGVGYSETAWELAAERRTCSLMGNSQGRDNVKKRAARRRKTERLASAKKSASSKKTAK